MSKPNNHPGKGHGHNGETEPIEPAAPPGEIVEPPEVPTLPEANVIYFEDGFETGDLSKWSGSSNTTSALVTSPVHGGKYSLDCHYQLPAEPAGHFDTNIYLYKIIDRSPESIFVRGWIYLALPENGGSQHPVQRKLIWISPDEQNAWSCGLTTDSTTPDGMILRFFVNGSATCNVLAANASPQYDIDNILWGKWNSIEIEVRLNTPSADPPYDGIARVWLNGVLVIEDTDMNLRGTATSGIGYVSFGRQADRSGSVVIDEHRYWDDICISSARLID